MLCSSELCIPSRLCALASLCAALVGFTSLTDSLTHSLRPLATPESRARQGYKAMAFETLRLPSGRGKCGRSVPCWCACPNRRQGDAARVRRQLTARCPRGRVEQMWHHPLMMTRACSLHHCDRAHPVRGRRRGVGLLFLRMRMYG